MKKLMLIIMFLIAGSSSYCAEKNIFEWGKGPEHSVRQGMPNNRDFDSDQEFIAYSKAFRQDKNLVFFDIPKDAAARTYHFAGLGPFTVNEATCYRLSMCVNKFRYLDTGYVYVSFFKGNKSLGSQSLLAIPATQTVSMIGYFVDFATPVQTDNIVIWFGISGGNNKPIMPGSAAILADVKIVETGKVGLTGSAAKYAGKNLSPVSDFEKEKLGLAPEWAFMKSGGGQYKLDVNIVENQPGKCLQIIKANANKDPWFNFTLPEGNFYYGNLVRFSLRVKGTGAIRLGVWWWKPAQDYEYFNSELIKLTEQWQNVQYEVYCNDPSTISAAIAICLDWSAQANVLADDINCSIVSPQAAPPINNN